MNATFPRQQLFAGWARRQGQPFFDLQLSPGTPRQFARQCPRPAAFRPDRYPLASQTVDPHNLDLAFAEPPQRLVEHRPKRFESGCIAPAIDAGFDQTDAHSRMRVEQQGAVFHRPRRRHKFHFDAGARERRTVAFPDLIVRIALGSCCHDDQVRRHATQHHNGRVCNRDGRHGDRDCRPIISKDVSERARHVASWRP
jgi:hypothetical protein